MKHYFKGRTAALVTAIVLLAGVTTVFASENAVKHALSDLYGLMAQNRATAKLDALEIKVLENAKGDADRAAAKIFNTGVYEQGFDNALTRDVAPLEAQSRIEAQKKSQAVEPLQREAALYRAIQSLSLTRAEKDMQTRLLALTREDAAIAKARYDAGVISAADLSDAQAAVASAELNIEKLAVKLTSAELAVNRQAGTELDAVLESTATDGIALLETLFSDPAGTAGWIEAAQQRDPDVFGKSEALRFLDMKLALAAKYIPETHSRVVEMRRDQEDARLTLADAKTGIEVSLRNLLNDRLTAADSLEMAKLDLEQAKRHRAQAQSRFEAGLFSRADLIARDREVENAQYAVLSATANLNGKEADLRVMVGKEIIP
mgnify:FL=1